MRGPLLRIIPQPCKEIPQRPERGRAIYIHVPFCRSLCTYCGCNSRITQSRSVGEPYVHTVLKEWELYRQTLGRTKPTPLSEMHFGGGTPTFLSPAELDELVSGTASLPRVWQRARETWCAKPGRLLFGNYTGQVSLRGMIESAAAL